MYPFTHEFDYVELDEWLADKDRQNRCPWTILRPHMSIYSLDPQCLLFICCLPYYMIYEPLVLEYVNVLCFSFFLKYLWNRCRRQTCGHGPSHTLCHHTLLASSCRDLCQQQRAMSRSADWTCRCVWCCRQTKQIHEAFTFTIKVRYCNIHFTSVL